MTRLINTAETKGISLEITTIRTISTNQINQDSSPFMEIGPITKSIKWTQTINAKTSKINLIIKTNSETIIISPEANMETKKTMRINKALEINPISMAKPHTWTKTNTSNPLIQIREDPTITTETLTKDSIKTINLIGTIITSSINLNQIIIKTSTKTSNSHSTKQTISTTKIHLATITNTTKMTEITISDPTISINLTSNSKTTDPITIDNKITRKIDFKTNPDTKTTAITSTETIRAATITIFTIITLLHSPKTYLPLNLYPLNKTIQFWSLSEMPMLIKTHQHW